MPLIRGVTMLRAVAFAAEENPDDPDAPLIVERWPEYESTTTVDLPGYIEIEIETTSGSYANWVLELAWSLAEETVTEQETTPDSEAPDGQDPGQNPSPTPAPQPDSTGRFGEIT